MGDKGVESFAIDSSPVTNGEFAKFVEATGYITVAERAIDQEQYPRASPELCVPGSAVFRRTRGGEKKIFKNYTAVHANLSPCRGCHL